MDSDLVVRLTTETLKTTSLVAAPMLVSALVVGLVISVLQAVTQINEATLTFIPKMAIVAIVIVLAGPWMLDVLTVFTSELLQNLPEFVRN